MAVWSKSACTQKPVPAANTRPWGFPSGSIVVPPVVRRYKPASVLYWKSAPCESSQEPPTNGSWTVVPGWLVVGSRSEEHTSALQSHRDLRSFPTRRSSDLACISAVLEKRTLRIEPRAADER